MMNLRIPTAGTPYNFADIFACIKGILSPKSKIHNFEEEIKKYLKVRNLLLVNSGTTACFLLLKLFKRYRKNSIQNEVIIPAYTAPSLLLPIEKAGLKGVLIDIDIKTFNMDVSKLNNAISDKTLAIMPIHMFGIPCETESLNKIIKDNIFIIEDAASSLGSKINNKHTGTIAPFGFYSLNRGKNISTFTGGILTWKDEKYTEILKKFRDELPELSKKQKRQMALKFIALTIAVRPIGYTLLNFLISRFKYTELHTDFDSFQYTSIQAAIGINLWKRVNSLSKKRIVNGKKLIAIFRNIDGIILPELKQEYNVAFNQFPILIEDLKQCENLEKELLKNGIETSHLYEKSLDEIFPYLKKNDSNKFKSANYLAKHLLLIPPHAQINNKSINKIHTCVKNIF